MPIKASSWGGLATWKLSPKPQQGPKENLSQQACSFWRRYSFKSCQLVGCHLTSGLWYCCLHHYAEKTGLARCLSHWLGQIVPQRRKKVKWLLSISLAGTAFLHLFLSFQLVWKENKGCSSAVAMKRQPRCKCPCTCSTW